MTQPSNKKYTYVYSPLASTPEEFYEKFVITNPNLNHAFIKGILDQVKAKSKYYTPRWNEYQKGKETINMYSFIQNSDWISKEYFDGMFSRLIIEKVLNFDESTYYSMQTSFNNQTRKVFREPTKEEAISRNLISNIDNPSGYNYKLHNEEHLIIDRFLNGESVPNILKTYGGTCKVIRNILISANVYYDTIHKRKLQRHEDNKAKKIENKKILAEKRSIKQEESRERKRLKEEAKLLITKTKVQTKKVKLQVERVNGIVVNISEIFDMGETIDKDKIYTILRTKPHNIHYLKRYIDFIFACINKNSLETDLGYTEIHHICPKAKDLFPQYFGFINNPWNKAILTGRQHFIAHWMLWKAYGGSQVYAFRGLCNQKSKYQLGRYNKLNSTTFELARIDNCKLQSKNNTGMAAYKNAEGEVVYCSTTHEKVLSGEYTSLTAGINHKWGPRTEAQIKERNQQCLDAKWVQYPIRKINLYFLDVKITMNYTRGMPEILPYIDQGWGFRATKEFRTMTSIKANANMSSESRQRAGKSITKTSNEKNESGTKQKRLVTVESRKALRTSDKDHTILCFDTNTNEFVEIDFLDVQSNHIKCFTQTNGRVIFDEYDNRKFYSNGLKELPSGYYEYTSKETALVFDKLTKQVINIFMRNITNDQVKFIVPNNKDRIKFYDTLQNKNVYWHKDLVEKYGIPVNYSIHTINIRTKSIRPAQLQ